MDFTLNSLVVVEAAKADCIDETYTTQQEMNKNLSVVEDKESFISIIESCDFSNSDQGNIDKILIKEEIRDLEDATSESSESKLSPSFPAPLLKIDNIPLTDDKYSSVIDEVLSSSIEEYKSCEEIHRKSIDIDDDEFFEKMLIDDLWEPNISQNNISITSIAKNVSNHNLFEESNVEHSSASCENYLSQKRKITTNVLEAKIKCKSEEVAAARDSDIYIEDDSSEENSFFTDDASNSSSSEENDVYSNSEVIDKVAYTRDDVINLVQESLYEVANAASNIESRFDCSILDNLKLLSLDGSSINPCPPKKPNLGKDMDHNKELVDLSLNQLTSEARLPSNSLNDVPENHFIEEIQNKENTAGELKDQASNKEIKSRQSIICKDLSDMSFMTQLDKIKSIIGISYIIALKNAMDENMEAFLTYDCVLCNPYEEKLVSGFAMKSHIKTRDHLLNVMEVENYALYSIYKNSEMTAPLHLFKSYNCEAISSKGIFTMWKTFSEKKENLAKTIAHLKQVSKEKFMMCASSSENATSSESTLQDHDNLSRVSKFSGATSSKNTSTAEEHISRNGSTVPVSQSAPKQNHVKPHHTSSIPTDKVSYSTEKSDKMKLAFEKVVIVTNKYYYKYMKLLCPVDIILCPDNSTDSLISTIKKRVKSQPPRTLWLSHTGLFSIVKSVYWDTCQNSKPSCDKPMSEVIPDKDVLNGSEDFAGDIKAYTLSLMEKVNSILSPGSAFIIIPPFPPTFMVLDSDYHRKYHYLEQDAMFYFASDATINSLKICYTRLSRDLTSLAISELGKLGIKKKSLEAYKIIMSDWNYDIIIINNNIRNPHTLKSYKLSKWIYFMSKFITENLSSRNLTGNRYFKRGGRKKSKSKMIKNCGASPHTVNKLNDRKSEVEINTRSEASVLNTSFNDTRRVKNTRERSSNNLTYDHVVFIFCCRKQMDVFPDVTNSSDCVSVVNARSAIDWNDIREKLQSIKSLDTYKNILFVVIGSIKMLGIEFREPYCLKVNCKNPVSYVNLNSLASGVLVDGRIKNVRYLLSKLRNQFTGRAKVILSPLFYTTCAEKPSIMCENHHKALHESMSKANNLCLVLGGKEKWKQVVKRFNIAWEAEMFSLLTEREEIIKTEICGHFSRKREIIYWQNLKDPILSGDANRNSNCTSFLRSLILIACPSQRPNNKSDLDPCRVSMSSSVSSNHLPNSPCTVKPADYSISSTKVVEHISDDELYQMKSTNKLFFDYQKLCDKTFKHAFILGTEELVPILSTKQFKYIEHICCDITCLSDSSLKKIIGRVGNHSVIFMVLDISSFTKKLTVSSGCKQFKCVNPIPALDFDTEYSDIGDLTSYATGKLSRIKSCIKTLSAFASIFVLPLLPTRLYWDNSASLEKHIAAHVISKAGFYVTHTEKEKWQTFSSCMTNQWNEELKTNVEKYFLSRKIEKCIDGLKFLTIEDDVNQFPNISEIPRWENIFLAYLEIIMENKKKEATDQPTKNKEDTLGPTASNKILLMGDSCFACIAEQSRKVECIRGINVDYAFKDEDNGNEVHLIPENVQASHTDILLFGVTNDAYCWSAPTANGHRALFPNSEFSAEKYALKMETFVKACRKINPAIRVVLILPPVLDLVHYNKSLVPNYSAILQKECAVFGNMDSWLHDKSIKVHREITKLKFSEIHWPGKIVYPLQCVARSFKPWRSHVTLFLSRSINTLGEHSYLDDGVHLSQIFIDRMWSKLLASHIWTAESEEDSCYNILNGSSRNSQREPVLKKTPTLEFNAVWNKHSFEEEAILLESLKSKRFPKSHSSGRPLDSLIANEMEKTVTYIVGYLAGGGQTKSPEEVRRLMADYLHTCLEGQIS